MKDFTESAGVPKGSFYSYFATRPADRGLGRCSHARQTRAGPRRVPPLRNSHPAAPRGLVGATTHIETDLPGRQDRFCEHLAAIALGESNPIESGWLVQFIAQANQATRTAWANGVLIRLRTGATALAERRWAAWIKTYWQLRIDSIPAPLDQTEAAAMAAWSPHLGEAFPEAVQLAVVSPAALDPRNLLIHSLIETGAATSYPEDTVRLITHLLTQTAPVMETEYQLEECVRLLRQSAEQDKLRQLAEAAIRAGYQSGAAWIDDSDT